MDKVHVHALMESTAVPVSTQQTQDVSTRVQLVNVAMTIVLTQWTLVETQITRLVLCVVDVAVVIHVPQLAHVGVMGTSPPPVTVFRLVQ